METAKQFLAAQRELALTVQERFGSLDIAFLNAISPDPIATPLYDSIPAVQAAAAAWLRDGGKEKCHLMTTGWLLSAR